MGEIGGEELVLDVDETIFVAVAEDVERSKTTVLWAARNFSGKKICLLYVHRTARAASWTHKKLVGGSFKKHDVKVIERVEKPKVDELMNSYLQLLSETEIQTDKLCIAGQNIEECIVELIARHKIKWLVMGAASDKHYSWKMTDLKSKKAIFVCKKAPDSCHIWFLCKGYLIFTRASNDDSNNRQTMPPLVQLDSDNETRKSEKLESSYMRRRLRYWRSLLEQDGEKDTGQLEREKVEPRAPPLFSSGSSSSFGEPVGPEPVSPELVDSDTLNTSNVEEKEREGDVARKVHRYDKAMHDIGQSDRTVYGEAGKKWEEDASTTEALCKAKALEGLCIKESSQRKRLEELLEKEKLEVKMVIEQNNGFMKELQMVQGRNLKLESQMRKLQDLEKEHGEKFDTAMELLKSFRQKRDEIRIDHENAVKEVNALRRLVKGETGESSGSEMLDYSFMEINEATNEFDPSWKLGEGKYGSVYKGNLQHLQVAVKMLPSYGSLNHFEFERRVEILSRVRHPNLVTLMGACPESRSLIYQYIPNGSLEDCFSSENNVPALSWESRIRIASEICSALLFLHSNIPCIIHGNLKPSKILLDSNLVTKINDYGISQLIPIDGLDKSDPHVDPHYFVSREMTLESDIYAFGIILLQLLTRRPVSGILRDVKCALENDNISAVLDNSAGDWPVARGKKLANVAIRCCKKNPMNRPDLAVVLRFIDRMKAPEVPSSETSSYANQNVPRRPPSHYLCPIFQEVMKDPLIAADGFTYEAEAIREWLANGHDTSPMTNLKMEDCNLIPNHVKSLSSILFTSFALLFFLVHAQDQSGFISIDCGIPDDSSYNDETTGIKYVSDSAFVDSGTTKRIAAQFQSSGFDRHLLNVRSFPQSKRSCYDVPTPRGKGFKYLIRTRFMYGNYDDLGRVPEFDLYLGVNFWDSVKLDDATTILNKEIITIPLLDNVQVCVVDKNAGTPFLSVLEIRLLLNTTYETPYDALTLLRRLDYSKTGKLPSRYKDDIYDRIWTPRIVSSEYKILNTSLTVDQFLNNGYQPASTVMSTAETARNESLYLTLSFRPPDPNAKFYVYMHFAEIEVLKSNQTREFSIWLNEDVISPSFKLRYLLTDTFVTPDPVSGITINFSLLQPPGEFVLPPIINALEVYQVNEFLQIPTHPQDVDAMRKIKATYRVKKNWQGDPCVPVDYSWEGIDCIQSDNTTNPRVVSLNISFSELRGQIDPAFSNLTSIRKLDLSGNTLTGEIPAFLANLPNLTELNVEGNKLTGIVPQRLHERSKNGSLSLRFGRNPDLCLSDSCSNTKKKNKNGYIIPLVVVGIIVVLLTALALFRRFKKKQQRGTLGERNGPLKTAKRYFKYSEVVNITNNFERVIGKGGFGKVYHGVINGEQVAVKVLSEESAQGYKEFRAEVDLLMRVHHTNLTSLVGYCNEINHMVLIYEYMANENLGDYLAGKRSFILSWEERLKISLDAAQGLEYLHNGCKPPIVHRDVKPTNILLNEKLQAKMADFGLSRSFSVEGSGQISTVVAGSIGYLDPEYYSTRQMNEKSDVYSLGVVLLEVITGQPAIASSKTEKVHISDHVRSILANGDIRGIVDQRLRERYDVGSAWKMSEIALACTEHTSAQRPTMSQVVMELKQIVYGIVTDQENYDDSTKMLTVNLDTEMVPRAR